MKLKSITVNCCLAAGICLAQNPAATPNTNSAGQSSNTSNSAAGQGSDKANKSMSAGSSSERNRTTDSDASMVGASDRKFMMNAAMGGMAEVQMAQLAQQKATSDEVKKYAAMLEKDHSKANEDLKKVAAQKNVSLPTDIGPMHQAHMTKLQALSGAAFDRQYTKMMVADHKKDIKEFQREVSNGMDSDVKTFASTTLPHLQEHLSQVQQIAAKK